MKVALSHPVVVVWMFAASTACTTRSPPLLPEIELTLDCSQLPRRSDGVAVEKALFAAGFDVLNAARLAEELKMRFEPPVSIDAIDGQGHIVSIRGVYAHLPRQQRSQRASLIFAFYDRPNGPKASSPKSQLSTLARQLPMCQVTRVEPHANGPSAASSYEKMANDIRSHLNSARVEAPNSETHRQHRGPI